MKKVIAILLVLLLPTFALAEETVTANAVAQSSQIYQVTAPYSGVLKPFDWAMGDVAEAQSALFEMETVNIYAPVDGTVRGIFAQKGDQTAHVLSQYGMLAAIEKKNPQIVNATVENAYNKADNKIIHVGERVYLEQVSDRDNEGEGRVSAVSAAGYVVEVTAGDFGNNVSVEVYRDPDCSTKQRIGSGRTTAAAEVPVTGAGYVLHVAAFEGDAVQRGDLLFTLAAQDAEYGLGSAVLTAPVTGAVEPAVTSAMQVYKGQLLARIHDLSAMEVVASVDEMDLDRVSIGQSVEIVFDRYQDETIRGIVTGVSRIGVPRQNATYYDVTISVDSHLEILPGMNAVVSLP